MTIKRCVFWAFGLFLCAGCAQYEQYPHPYVDHGKLPFTHEGASELAVPSLNHPRIAVCDFQSQAISPIGAHFIERNLQQPVKQSFNAGLMADVVGRELVATHADVVRIGDGGPWQSTGVGTARTYDAILKGTVLCMEYSEHGLKQAPYRFAFVTIRFTLDRAIDGQRLCQLDVAAYRKITPGPQSTQESVAADAFRVAARELASNESFRSSVEQSQKGS